MLQVCKVEKLNIKALSLSRFAVFCGRLDHGDDGAALTTLRRALTIACELEEGAPLASHAASGEGPVGPSSTSSHAAGGALGDAAPDATSEDGGGRLKPGSMAVAEIIPLPLMLSDPRFYAYFAGRTQVPDLNARIIKGVSNVH